MTRLRPLSRLQRRIVMPHLTRPDPWLLAAVAVLVGLGVVTVFNISYFQAQDRYGDPLALFRKHLVALAIGSAALVAVSRMRAELLERWAYVLLPLGVVALLLVLVPGIGVKRGGAQRWIAIGGFGLQPSEFVKLGVVIFLARWISHRREPIRHFASGILPAVLIVGLCAGLVLWQPDYGTAAILGAVLLLMLFVGGARPTHVGLLATAGLALLVAAAALVPYRRERLLAFLYPFEHSHEGGFQLLQSLIAFGSGGLTGVGLGHGHQKLFFLPEPHTDFAFALIGEELGLLGALAVLALFGLVALRGFRVAARHPDSFASLLAFGLTSVITLTVVVNVGVVLGLLPTKGLPLPFLSYGGSALLSAMLGVGVLAALSRMTG